MLFATQPLSLVRTSTFPFSSPSSLLQSALSYGEYLLMGTSDMDAVDVSAGTDHRVAVKQDGTVWSWGDSGDYQTGLGTAGIVQVPTMLRSIDGVRIVFAGSGA